MLSGRIDALKIPARWVEHSLTESALFPFQAEPTQQYLLLALPLPNFLFANHWARIVIGTKRWPNLISRGREMSRNLLESVDTVC
jgi:hypothetical protein